MIPGQMRPKNAPMEAVSWASDQSLFSSMYQAIVKLGMHA